MNPSDLVFLIHDEIVKNPSKYSFVKLKHPRSGQSCLYVWKSGDSGRLFEVQRISEKHRSWFLGSKIKSDGGAYLCTPVDLLFLVLPVLPEQNRFTTLQGLLADSPELMTILPEGSSAAKRLSHICDSKVVGEHTVFRYNESLALNWLAGRVAAVSRALQDLKNPELVQQVQLLHASGSAATKTVDGEHGAVDARAPAFTSDSVQARMLTETTLSPEICIQFAFQLVSDYLLPDLADKLRDHIKLGGVEEQRSRVDSSASFFDDTENLDPSTRRSSQSTIDSLAQPTEDYSLSLKSDSTPKRTEPVSKKAKYSKGIQSITSFFGKRST